MGACVALAAGPFRIHHHVDAVASLARVLLHPVRERLAHRLRGWGWPLIDAQVENPHLLRLGAEAWPRTEFLALVGQLVDREEPAGDWAARFGSLAARDLA